MPSDLLVNLGRMVRTLSIFRSGALTIAALVLAGTSVGSAQTVRIRCGTSGTYTASDGTVWQSDADFTGGQVLYTGYPVTSTPDPTLYRNARQGYYGDFSYAIPVTNGSYQLTLKFAEIQFASPGQRVFNVTVNGTQVLTGFDIVAQAGYWNAIDKQFPVTVSNGTLQILVHGTVNYGLINAIQLVPVATPALQLSTSSLTYSATAGAGNPAAQPVTISNTGGGTLNWTATKTQTWLSLSANSGTAPSTLSISAASAGLIAGTYTDTVTINGGSGGTQTVAVTLNVAPAPQPVLGPLPPSLSFSGQAGGANPASQNINITNTGGGTLTWTASKTQAWLTLSGASGTAPSTLGASVAIGSLTAGTYNDTVTITPNAGSSQTVGITLVVSPAAPAMSVGPSSLTYTATVGGSNPASQNINITNTGGGTLTWTAAKTQSWLTLAGSAGTAPSSLATSVSIGSLTAGTYNDTVTITPSTGSQQTVGITLVVNSAAPVLSLGSSSLSYSATAGGSNPASQNIGITNTGGGTLTWSAAKTQSWLTLSGVSGTAPSTLGVSISIGSLTAGTYNDTVTITPSTGSPQTVSVTLVVNPAAPVLNISTSSATFSGVAGGSNPASQSINITNTGGGTLNWTAAKTQSWLTLSAASGTAPASLGLSISTAGLTAATYHDTVTITGAGSAPTISVTLTITAGGATTNSAAFIKLDTTTLGSWKGVYGTSGYDLEGATAALPSYAQVAVNGAATYTWTGSTTDARALQTPAGNSRFAATWYQSPSFNFDVNLTDGATHQFTLYALDYDNSGRIERVDITDATTGTLLDTRSLSGFNSGEYASWNFSGHVIVTLTQLAGGNAVVAGLFFDPAGQAPSGTGAFVKLDTTTQGSWKGAYGGDGYDFLGSTTTSLPAYAQVAVNGATTFTWSGATTDPRALQQPTGSSRIAATWYSYTSFSFDVNLTDGGTHQIALYAMDYDNSGRSERVDVIDNATSLVLDSRTLNTFSAGQYLVWNLQGHVIIKLTMLSGGNAVASGLFFSGGPQLAPAALSVSANTVNLTGTANAASSTSQGVSITNTGGGTLPWTASGTQPWLTLSAISGTAPSTLTIGASTILLGVGTYTDTVTVGSAGATGSPQLITVNLVLTSAPALSVSSSALTFNGVTGGSNPVAQTLNISNAGTGTLNWTAAKTQSWLTLSSTSGTGPAVVNVSVSTAGLGVGTYNDTITVTAPGALQSPKTVSVTLVLTTPDPSLSLSSSAVNFAAIASGSNPAAQSVNIGNGGGGTLNWTAGNTHSWLTLSAASGTAPATLGLTASISGLQAGTYTDTVTISAAGASSSPQTVAVTLTVSPAAGSGTSASFIKLDTTTQGSWEKVYGSDGYDAIEIPANVPSYAQVTVNGAFIFTWAGGTSDARALQVPNAGSRIAATWYASGSFSYDLNLTDGLTHQISLYATDYDSSGRAERIDIIDAASGSVLDTRTLTQFSGGQFPVWNITGHVTIRVTQLLGPNAVISAIFFDTAGAAPVGTTLFGKLDTTTIGNWENAYGGDGYEFVGEPASLPAYAVVNVSGGAQTFLWAGGTADARALEIPNSINRIAGTWYQSGSFGLDVNLTDGNTHQVALYALDYDNSGRSERIDVIDSATGVTLDSRTIGPFVTGEYLVWNLAGHVVFQVTQISGTNAVLSGIFFGRSPLVTTPETLNLSTNAITLAGVVGGSNPGAQGVAITNSGIGTLTWTANGNQPWLTLSALSGTAPSSLSIGASLNGLTPGTYTGTVGVGAAGALQSPQAITVTLNVRAQPAILTVSQAGLTFATATAGTNPASQTVAITNGGTGSLSWTAAATQSWVTLSSTAGTAPSSLSIGVSTAGLSTGVYTDTVVISSAGAGGSPTSVTITLVIGTSLGQHYVSTQGTPSGDGSIGNPWDLQTALYQPATVQPSDTIWVRGGTYGNGAGIFYSRLVGTPALPIVVKQFPGERATIDGWLQVGCCDQNPQPSEGAYVWFWGLEFASSVTDRTGLPNGQSTILDAVDTWAPGTKFINNIVHDSRVGISMWKEAVGAEAYGNLSYFNGFQASDRGHGHGFYVQNNTGTMTISNNIIFDMFDNGMQFYGSAAGPVKNLTVQGNIAFNNGALSTGPNMADDVIFVNTNGVSGIQLLNNYFYFTPSLGLGYNEMGWPGPNQDIVVNGNYFMGGFEAFSITDWASINFQNNTVYTNQYLVNFITGATPSGYTWDNNKYFGTGVFSYNGSSTFLSGWQGWTSWDTHSTSSSSAPTGVWTFVEPNKYDSGRANIAVYNWDLAPTASVDVSSAIPVGTRYQILDAQNYYGPPVASGTYTGTPIVIPMTGLTIATPNGTVPSVPTHTAPQFGAFVLTTLQ
jgi:hypothetical protein